MPKWVGKTIRITYSVMVMAGIYEETKFRQWKTGDDSIKYLVYNFFIGIESHYTAPGVG